MEKLSFEDLADKEYNLTHAFKRIEEKLIDDMMKHINYSDPTNPDKFKVEQLKRLEQYRQKNLKEYTPIFEELNQKMEELIKSRFYQGLSLEEQKIMRAIHNGYNAPYQLYSVKARHVHDLNEKKLEALIQATKKDMIKAEHAILRKAEDSYRKIIFDAQVALNTGSLNPRQAIDMATKDFLANGIQCIKYKNGAVHSIGDYADMAIKTANKRAYLYGEGQKRAEYGCHFVIVNKRGGTPCKCCAPYVGQILVDDVYSGGTKEEAKKYGYSLLSEAMDNGLYHPRCKDVHSGYYEGITKIPEPLTKEQLAEIEEKEKKKQKEYYRKRMVKKYKQMAQYAEDEETKKKYRAKVKEWQNKEM